MRANEATYFPLLNVLQLRVVQPVEDQTEESNEDRENNERISLSRIMIAYAIGTLVFTIPTALLVGVCKPRDIHLSERIAMPLLIFFASVLFVARDAIRKLAIVLEKDQDTLRFQGVNRHPDADGKRYTTVFSEKNINLKHGRARLPMRLIAAALGLTIPFMRSFVREHCEDEAETDCHNSFFGPDAACGAPIVLLNAVVFGIGIAWQLILAVEHVVRVFDVFERRAKVLHEITTTCSLYLESGFRSWILALHRTQSFINQCISRKKCRDMYISLGGLFSTTIAMLVLLFVIIIFARNRSQVIWIQCVMCMSLLTVCTLHVLHRASRSHKLLHAARSRIREEFMYFMVGVNDVESAEPGHLRPALAVGVPLHVNSIAHATETRPGHEDGGPEKSDGVTAVAATHDIEEGLEARRENHVSFKDEEDVVGSEKDALRNRDDVTRQAHRAESMQSIPSAENLHAQYGLEGRFTYLMSYLQAMDLGVRYMGFKLTVRTFLYVLGFGVINLLGVLSSVAG